MANDIKSKWAEHKATREAQEELQFSGKVPSLKLKKREKHPRVRKEEE